MSESPETRWPEYYPDLEKQLHALGVIAAVYNRLEHQLLGLFLAYVGFNNASSFLFARLRDNKMRIELLMRHVELKGQSDDIKHAVQHFCSCFDRASQNRNILMHAGISNVYEDGKITQLVFSKGAKQDAVTWNRFFLDLGRLRQVADGIHAASTYGRKLFVYVTSRYHSELQVKPVAPTENAPFPDKPPLPELLNPQDFPTATGDSYQRQS